MRDFKWETDTNYSNVRDFKWEIDTITMTGIGSSNGDRDEESLDTSVSDVWFWFRSVAWSSLGWGDQFTASGIAMSLELLLINTWPVDCSNTPVLQSLWTLATTAEVTGCVT